jgi:bilirubin oxidase
MMLINDTVTLDDIEIWTLINVSTVAHPFHIHDVHFFILDINGNPNIPDYLKGPKDVVLVNNNDTIRFVTQFLDFATPVMPENSYMYHCHILSHEDGGMMHQFVVREKPTGVMKFQQNLSWDIFPNPASGEIFLRGESIEASRFRLLNALGNICFEADLPAFDKEYPISLPKISAGLYCIQWIRKDGVHARRLLVQN